MECTLKPVWANDLRLLFHGYDKYLRKLVRAIHESPAEKGEKLHKRTVEDACPYKYSMTTSVGEGLAPPKEDKKLLG
ncbi:MAG: hypothetical protein IJC81_00320 [Clostridia bacterium]|nr:hypothetical protein [Clostridia bacterium]